MHKKLIYILLLFIIPLLGNNLPFRFAKISATERTSSFKDSTNVKGYTYFTRHGITMDSLCNTRLYNEVYGWLGVRYCYAGHTKYGVDCSGFVTQIYKLIYSIKLGGGAGDIYKMVKPIEKKDLKEGDLIFFKIRHSYISHVALYLSNNKFVHATTGYGVRIDDLNAPYYYRYYFSAGRIDKPLVQNTN